MFMCKEEGYILKGQNTFLQPLLSPLRVPRLRGKLGDLTPAVSNLVTIFFSLDSLWRDSPRQHWQLLLP